MISVIIPCYNYGKFLPEALNSILAQSYSDWECLIIDDGSTDNTKDIVMEYMSRDNRIRYLFQENQGVSAARNLGLKNIQGEYIQFLDADDVLEINKLKNGVEFLKSNSQVDIVYSYELYRSTDSKGDFLKNIFRGDILFKKEYPTGYNELLRDFIIGNHMCVFSPLYRKSIIEKSIFFDTSLDCAEDWDYILRCAYLKLAFYYSDTVNGGGIIRKHSAFKLKRDQLGCRIRVRKKISEFNIAPELLNINKNILDNLERISELIEWWKAKKYLTFLKGCFRYAFHKPGLHYSIIKMNTIILLPGFTYNYLCFKKNIIVFFSLFKKRKSYEPSK